MARHAAIEEQLNDCEEFFSQEVVIIFLELLNTDCWKFFLNEDKKLMMPLNDADEWCQWMKSINVDHV